ncbi:p53 and DNA damage-regulated protein 1 [Macrosteles quadrilineatus]|uniref:p53 and DNA damage-regulated protein 1 n=1 Tax=Macrosteles quadrilineatus TaxID=74068 RepID=UPI0023E24197|nr:p53 and DNA damage-regulated protein 1 [Macrosteles quadrilineatus]XP_054278869.1 p53 and DNA damage-regulated protein 1 [Macrosteles quadrilineatus]
MENPKLTLKQLHAAELQADSILRDRAEIVDLDRRRNSNREALRALSKEKGKKTWFTLGPILVKLPVSTASDLLNKDQVTINSEINKLRSELKVKVNDLRDLEFEDPVPGLNLKPMTREEMSAINQVLGYHAD